MLLVYQSVPIVHLSVLLAYQSVLLRDHKSILLVSSSIVQLVYACNTTYTHSILSGLCFGYIKVSIYSLIINKFEQSEWKSRYLKITKVVGRLLLTVSCTLCRRLYNQGASIGDVRAEIAIAGVLCTPRWQLLTLWLASSIIMTHVLQR